MPRVLRRRRLLVGLGILAVLAGGVAVFLLTSRQAREVVELAGHGEERALRDDDVDPPRTAATEQRAKLFVLALDGIDRALLYDMLRKGELPGLARLLGGATATDFSHAHFDERVLSVLPSSTIPAWASLFTGEPPAVHGVAGNEFFIREERSLAAPAPVSFPDATPALQSYTDDYADDLVPVPTIYEQIRRQDPGVRIWVSMSQFHRGADLLLMANRTVLARSFSQFLDGVVGGKNDHDLQELYASIDTEVIDTLTDALEGRDVLPDVLTLYLIGADLFAHEAQMGPDPARRRYLAEVLDPSLVELHRTLVERRALDDRFVAVIADHGHTDVVEDDLHALGTERERGDGEPPAVLRAAGFRVRPFAWKVPDEHDYQAVMAYGGATAFVYLADRSTCAAPGSVCDFRRPPRFEEDVLSVADAFHRSSREGVPVAGMRGTIDLVLTRRPRPVGEPDEAFQVYVGGGRLEDVSSFLAREARPDFVQLDERLRELGAGPRGERAGDVLLLARGSGESLVDQRYYFSSDYESWHGSPSRRDSEVPFILAHPRMDTAALRAIADRALGSAARLHHLGRLLVQLRLGER